MRDDLVIRDMVAADARVVGHLFVDVDTEVFPSLLGGGSTFGAYVEATFGSGRFFSSETVRVAEIGGHVVGMYLVFSNTVEVLTHDMCDIDGLPTTLDDVLLGELEAFAMAESWSDDYLCAVCVDNDVRGQGIGKALVADALQRHDNLLLHCRVDNDRALDLYKSLGFVMRCFLIGLSEDGEDESPMMIVMEHRK